MSKVTPEKTHALLEKLASYVMNEMPTNQKLSAEIEGLRNEMNDRFEQVDTHFEQVDQRFEQVDRRFEQVDQRFEQVNQRFKQVDQRFEKADTKIDKLVNYVMTEVPTKQDMNNRFEQVDKRLTGLEDGLKETKQDVKSILNGMDNTVKDMEILRTEQIAIHSGLRRLENRVDGLERKSA